MNLFDFMKEKLAGNTEIELLPNEIEQLKDELKVFKLDKKNPNLRVGKLRLNKIFKEQNLPFVVESSRKTIQGEKISTWLLKCTQLPKKLSDNTSEPKKLSFKPTDNIHLSLNAEKLLNVDFYELNDFIDELLKAEPALHRCFMKYGICYHINDEGLNILKERL